MKRKVVPEGFTNNGWEKILTFFLNSGRHNALQCTTFDKNPLHQFTILLSFYCKISQKYRSGPSCSKPDLANPRLVEILIWVFFYQ